MAVSVGGCGGSQTNTTAPGVAATQTQAVASAPKIPAEIKAEKAQHAKEAAEERAKQQQEAKERAHEEAVNKLEEAAGHGLVATKSTFEANNTASESEPPVGSDNFRIGETNNAGRVTSYESNNYASPPFSKREPMLLLDSVNLPHDATIVHESADCMAWHSVILKRLIGSEYAEATTVTAPGDGAQMHTS
jgi:hypothetical protein